MYNFIMGLCTVSSLLLLLGKKENVLALWTVLLLSWENLETLNHLRKKANYEGHRYLDIYISLFRPNSYLSVNFILQYCLRYYFK